MDIVELTVKNRDAKGSPAARRLRRAGVVPANLYGHGMTPVSLEVNARELSRVLHTKAGENVVIQLKPEGVKLKESTCVFKDIQENPVTDHIDHVDFMVISLTEKIEVKVPIAILNGDEAVGVKEEGGVLDIVHHEIEVECLPTSIPEKISVDVKHLNIGDAVHLKDLAVPEGVKYLMDAEEVIAVVHAPRKEEEAPAEAEEAAQPEVIEKGKKPDEEGAAAAAPAKEAAPKKESGKG